TMIYTLSLHDALPIFPQALFILEGCNGSYLPFEALIRVVCFGAHGFMRHPTAESAKARVELRLRFQVVLELPVSQSPKLEGELRSEEHTSELQSLAYL